jgi:hypothetical protein
MFYVSKNYTPPPKNAHFQNTFVIIVLVAGGFPNLPQTPTVSTWAINTYCSLKPKYIPRDFAGWRVKVMLLLFMSMEWHYVSELQSLTVLFVHTPEDIWVWCPSWMILTGENIRTQRKTCLNTTFPTTWASTVTGRQLMTWAMTQPKAMFVENGKYWYDNHVK